MDRGRFFDAVRRAFGPLKQSQVDGFNAVLDAWGAADPRFIAYALATAWHETGYTMKPVKECGGPTYHHRMYDIEGERPHVARALGNVHPGDGARFCGRGYVQLTGRRNYACAGTAIGVDLLAAPDAAMVPEIAAKIMVRGMTEGWFTGRKLADYDGGGAYDAVNARRIINGTDKAKAIAEHYRKFLLAVLAGQAPAPAPPDIEPAAPKATKKPSVAEQVGGVAAGTAGTALAAAGSGWVQAAGFVLMALAIAFLVHRIRKANRG